MTEMSKRPWLDRVWWGLSGAALIAFTLLLIMHAFAPGVRSFADDGMSYLVMARYLSPWIEPSAAIVQAYPNELYPPLLPLLLALSGAAHDFAFAHALIALLFALALPAAFWLARAIGFGRLSALLFCVVLAASPLLWLLATRIVSEAPYLMLSLITLAWLTARADRPRSVTELVVIGVLFAALLAARSIAVTLIGAYLLWELQRQLSSGPRGLSMSRLQRWGGVIPLSIGALAMLSWHWIKPAEGYDRYVESDLAAIQARVAEGGVWGAIEPQLGALVDAWHNVWLPYWVEGLNPGYLVSSGLGILALLGVIRGVRRGELIAWYAALYLALLLIWPHPGQMSRLAFPIVPLLLLLALDMARRAAPLLVHDRLVRFATAVPLIALLVVVLPGTAFTFGRATHPAEPLPYSRISEFYHHVNIAQARRVAAIQLTMHRDLELLEEIVSEQAQILALVPGYVALLANRRAQRIPYQLRGAAFLRAVQASDADFVYLSRMHPRASSPETNGLELLPWFQGWSSPLFTTHTPDGVAVSVLLWIDRTVLDQLVSSSAEIHADTP